MITCEFIKHVEGNLFKADDDTSKNIRNETVQILKSINKCNIKSFENTVLSEDVAEVKRLISENTDILITRADKGNTTVNIHFPYVTFTIHNYCCIFIHSDN